jgi:predicted Zn-dependent protease with MMP-like domain
VRSGSRDWKGATAPSLDDFAALAEAAFAAIPAAFRERCGDVRIMIQEMPEAALLDELGIDDPFELTGLYSGVDLTQKSGFDSAPEPDMIFLYRRPLLDEWCERGDIELDHLIMHVLVHEIGHHFGLSDAEMHAIEEKAG